MKLKFAITALLCFMLSAAPSPAKDKVKTKHLDPKEYSEVGVLQALCLAAIGTAVGVTAVIVIKSSSSCIKEAPPPADTDHDGLPDAWEMEYFGDLNQLAEGDPDNDFFSNLEEYEAETDPTDPQSYPGNGPTVAETGSPIPPPPAIRDFVIRVEASNTLPPQWQPFTNFVATATDYVWANDRYIPQFDFSFEVDPSSCAGCYFQAYTQW